MYQGISCHCAHELNQTTFLLPKIASAEKGLTPVYETQVTDEICMNQEEEIPHSDDKELSKELKDKSKPFFYISEFQKIVLICDMYQCPLKETLNVNVKL